MGRCGARRGTGSAVECEDGVLEALGGGTVCGSNKKYEGGCRAGAISGAGGAGGRE